MIESAVSEWCNLTIQSELPSKPFKIIKMGKREFFDFASPAIEMLKN